MLKSIKRILDSITSVLNLSFAEQFNSIYLIYVDLSGFEVLIESLKHSSNKPLGLYLCNNKIT